MVSIVIRNKNESKALERILTLLEHHYKEDFNEIILVDNQSTDDSVAVAQRYNCRIETITDFTYGKAINLGIDKAKNNYVLLLSAHAIPIGQSFFKTSMKVLHSNKKTAGLRYINSIGNYELAHKNNYEVKQPLENGLMAACAMINKNVWEENKFDETLCFSEDKEWSKRVIDKGYCIKQIPETFFYFANRDQNAVLRRYQNESIANGILKGIQPQPVLRIFGKSFYNLIFKHFITFFKSFIYEFRLLKVKLNIRKALIKNKKH